MKLLGLLFATLAAFALALYVGSERIPASAVSDFLMGRDVATDEAWYAFALQRRMEQALTATLCGMSLSTAGLLMQTTFRNPLAGPSTMGVDSGANLGVAIVMLAFGGALTASTITLTGFALVVVSALVGAFLVIMLLLILSSVLRQDVTLLIAGIMISFLISSLISLLNYQATEAGVHKYVLWGMGSFSAVKMTHLPWFAGIAGVGLLLALLQAKPLNAMMLGDNYARNLGVPVRRTRTLLLLAAGLLTAVSTAFCGPITFLGLAVPHIARLLLRTSNHRTLLPATMLCGATLALTCCVICSLPGRAGVLPINVVTPVLGAPVIFYVLLRRRNRG